MSYRPFNELPNDVRFRVRGQQAEGIFEQVAPFGRYVRLGWDLPDVSMSKREMSSNIRSMPDYYSGGYLIEVVGLGRDSVLKIRTDKWDALKWWNTSGNEVLLFVWNSSKKLWALLDWKQSKQMIQRARNDGIREFESDGNQYYPIRWEWIEEVTDCHAP